jgi:hypothetical protein
VPLVHTPIFLLDTATGEPVEAELAHGIEDCHIDDWHRQWQPAIGEMKRLLQEQGISKDEWPQSSHWHWEQKMANVQGKPRYRGFCVTLNGVNQGMMRIDLDKIARLDCHKGMPLVTIEYLETAPWNQRWPGSSRRYKLVGVALLHAAIATSLKEEFKGRIGLASLPQSVSFYREQGMTEVGPDIEDSRLTYFEMTAEQAQAFMAQE